MIRGAALASERVHEPEGECDACVAGYPKDCFCGGRIHSEGETMKCDECGKGEP